MKIVVRLNKALLCGNPWLIDNKMMIKNPYRDNHTMALPNSSAASEERDNEHNSADYDKDPWCHGEVTLLLELLGDHCPVEEYRDADADYRQAE